MNVAVGCDHAGFPLKGSVIHAVESAGHTVLDCGAFSEESSDYPDFARKVAEAVFAQEAGRGILICGSGIGASFTASKIPGIRAAVCHDPYSASQGVEHDDMNVLCLGARVVDPKTVPELVRRFLNARFKAEERYVRRLEKVSAIEQDVLAGLFKKKEKSS